jgi:circadian clock protein KaiC
MSAELPARVSTGVAGLDEILNGGLLGGLAYMLRGGPGTGKTILGMHYLTAGADAGEDVLYVGFEEPVSDIERNAARLGFDLSGVEILDLSPDSDRFLDRESYGVFAPSEVEGDAVVDRIAERVEAIDPSRVFIDPLTQLRTLSPDDYQFRQEVASLMSYLKSEGATALFTTQPIAGVPDDDLQFIGDGAIEVERTEHGRRIGVTKLRGSDFQGGWHTLRIRDDGISVYPELVPDDYDREFDPSPISSGIEALDELLSGGIERGTVTVISGPSGVGKSTTGAHFLTEAAERGERAAAFLFEESMDSFTYRSESIGLPVEQMQEDGRLHLHEIEALSISPDEFAALVREEVEEHDARVVMIDGTAGYRLSLRGEDDDATRELHALCRYLRNMGVTTVLVEEANTVTGEFAATTHDISYLADNLLFLRYVEMRGEMRKTIGILKKRLSGFEPTLRELRIDSDGLWIGDPLSNLRGILTGTPEWTAQSDDSRN